MRRYETIFIVNPDLSEDERNELLERSQDLISKQDGFVVVFDEWGNKKLAYEIRKKNRGYYVYVDYCGTGPLVDELERNFRIDDRVLKFMTILLETNVDLEKLKQELAEEQQKKDEERYEEFKDEEVVNDESKPETSEDDNTEAEIAEEE